MKMMGVFKRNVFRPFFQVPESLNIEKRDVIMACLRVTPRKGVVMVTFDIFCCFLYLCVLFFLCFIF